MRPASSLNRPGPLLKPSHFPLVLPPRGTDRHRLGGLNSAPKGTLVTVALGRTGQYSGSGTTTVPRGPIWVYTFPFPKRNGCVLPRSRRDEN